MKKRTFLRNTIILTGSAILLRLVGMVFQVYISNTVGAEGMGLYQLIFSVYLLFITIATSGISMAVTRLVTENEALGQGSHSVMQKSIAFSLTLSMLSGGLLFYFAEFAGTVVLSDARTVLSLRVLALGLPFLSVSACFRGYFLALRKAGKSALMQIAEMLAEIIVLLSILGYFLPRGLEFACLALVIATTAAEVFACFFAYFLYRLERRNKVGREETRGVFRKILKIALPMAAGSYTRSIFNTAENVLIPKNLQKSGLSREGALSQLGMIKGMAIPVLFFPSVFLSSVASLLIPEIAESDALNHQKHVSYAVSRVFRMTLAFAMLAAGVFFFFSKHLSVLIYKNSEVGVYIRLLAPLIPFMYLDDLVDAMLKALNQQVSLLKINLCDSIIRVSLILLVIPKWGISGMILVLIVSNIFNPFLSILKLMRVAKVKLALFDWVVKPLFAVCASCLSVILFYHFVPLPYQISVVILLVILLYVGFLWLFRCITREDIRWAKSLFWE